MVKLTLFIIILLPVLGMALLIPRMMGDEAIENARQEVELAKGPKPAPEDTLSNFAKEGHTPLMDLQELHIVMTEALKDAKAQASFFYVDSDVASEFLLGKNSLHQAYIPEDHKMILEFEDEEEGKKKCLVDRWKSRIDVRSDGGAKFSLRSHGRDKEPNTKDDLIWPLKRR